MNRNERNALIVILILLVLGFLFWRFWSGRMPAAPAGVTRPPDVTTTSKPAPTPPTTLPVAKPLPPPPPPPPAPKPAAKPKPTPAPVPTTAAPPITLHKELIPKDISIVRCYYGQEIMPPGVSFGFDINGSGFTHEFEKMIKVESGLASIQVKNLKLVTANQIHGDMIVAADAPTNFVYPQVLIKGLPVFRAPEPFAVVRKGEVLTIVFVSMDDSGRSGRFRVITNLDEKQAKEFRVEPSTTGLQISNMDLHLPYVIEETLQIEQHVPTGEYGLAVKLGNKPIYKRDGIIRVVRPNIGTSGYIQGVTPADRYHRPGDDIQLYIHGTGLTAQDMTHLSAKVNEFDMGPATFTYISGSQIRMTFKGPRQAPVGSYGVTIAGPSGQKLFEKSGIFDLVGSNWIGGLQVAPPVQPGQRGTLKIIGRDFAPDFIKSLQLGVDEPGLVITNLHAVNASTLEADLAVGSAVAPGDYWIHLSAAGKKIEPPYGSIIKVGTGF